MRSTAGWALIALCLSAPAWASKRIDLEFRGPLREALQKIANQGGISLVLPEGDLEQEVVLVLHGLTAEEALASLSRTHPLSLTREGDLWVARGSVRPDRGAASAGGELDWRRRASTGDVVETGPVRIAAGEEVDSVIAFGGSATVDGHVKGDVAAFGGSILLGPRAEVDGDAVAFGGSVVRSPGARVGGEEVSFGGPRLPRLVSSGAETPHPAPAPPPRMETALSLLPAFLVRYAVLFGLGFLFLLFVPARLQVVESELRRHPVLCAFTGFISSIGLFALSILLLFTLVGIPLIPFLWLGAVLAGTMGLSAVANDIGARLPILRHRKTQASVLALGLLVLLGIGMVPVLGPLSLLCVGVFAFGAVIRSRFGQPQRAVSQAD